MQNNAEPTEKNTAHQIPTLACGSYHWDAPTPRLNDALAKARAKFPAIPKNRTSRVMKDGKLLYEFHYADLADVLSAVDPSLSENGLSIGDEIKPDANMLWLHVTLRHSSGEMRRSIVNLPANQDPQRWAAFLSYMRRYVASALLGVASEEDDDANRVQDKEHTAGPREREPKGGGKAKAAAGTPPAGAEPKAGIDPNSPASNTDMRGLFAQAKTSKWTEDKLKAAVIQLWKKDSFKLLNHGEIGELKAIVKKYGPGQFEKAFIEGQVVQDPDGHYVA